MLEGTIKVVKGSWEVSVILTTAMQIAAAYGGDEL